MTDFINPWGLYAFALLVPIILLYLLRPKPKELKIPSLMFIIDIAEKKRFRSFLKKIVKDPLLLLQLLAISLIVLVIADPFYTSKEVQNIEEDVVLVIDTSASMQAGNPSRFSQAKDIAESVLSSLDSGDKVSVVLAGNVPMLVLKQGSKSAATQIVNNLNPKASPTGVGSAILLAADIIKDSTIGKKIYVISDFSRYEGIDPLGAQRKALASGINVELMGVGSPGENMGIIGANFNRLSEGGCSAELLVKNFGSVDSVATIRLSFGNQVANPGEKLVKAGSSEVIYLASNCPAEEFEAAATLDAPDSLAVDNVAYAILPALQESRILLIRERDDSQYIKYALESIGGLEVDESYPPIYPQDYSSYDTIIFQSAKSGDVFDGTFSELKNFVESGGNLVLLSFPALLEVSPGSLEGLSPVEFIDDATYSGSPDVLLDHEIFKDVDVGEIRVNQYLYVGENTGAITLAEIAGTPLVSTLETGDGKVVFLGIYPNSTYSDFHLKPSFPIFWRNLIGWLGREESSGVSKNFRAGERLPSASNQTIKVKKPSGEVIEGSVILLDEAGFYEVLTNNMKVSASLLNEGESDISYKEDAEVVDVISEYNGETTEKENTTELFWIIAVFALLIVVIEWFYYKGRGSL